MKQKAKKIIAVYTRVSSSLQSTRSQEKDLKKWISAYTGKSDRVHWFSDKASGKTMNRKEWDKLYKRIVTNRVECLVVWRLDRLGRTASGLTKLFEELNKYKVKFISIRDSIDLSKPSGRLIANVLASVAAYETEVGSERIRAGQLIAKAKGVRWGGSNKGRLTTISRERAIAAIRMKKDGVKVCKILRTLKMNAPTFYRIIERAKAGILKV